MKTIRTLATVAVAALVAACSDTPTSAVEERSDQPLLRSTSTYPGPTGLSVTNSGGTPLISWTAVPGATSYTVSLITIFLTDYPSLYYGVDSITTTTSTSYLDVNNVYTGVYECNYGPDWGGDYSGVRFEYAVQANYSQGSSPILYSRHFAPIAQC